MLYREARSLAEMAGRLGRADDLPWLEAQAARIHKRRGAAPGTAARTFTATAMRAATPAAPDANCWPSTGRENFRCAANAPRRRTWSSRSGAGRGEHAHRHRHHRTAWMRKATVFEDWLSPRDFTWSRAHARATTRQVFSQVLRIEINGLLEGDRGRLIVPDFTLEDLSLFLPLWAGIPDAAAGEIPGGETSPRRAICSPLAWRCARRRAAPKTRPSWPGWPCPGTP